MGTRSLEGWISGPIQEQSTSPNDLGPTRISVLSEQPREICNPAARGEGNGTERGSGNSSAKGEGFLQQALPGPKTRWEMAPSSGCIPPKQICQENKVYNGNTSNSPAGTQEGGLVNILRYERRLFSYSGPPSIQEVPEIHVRWGDLPIQGAMFRLEHGTPSLHESAGPSRENSSPSGIPNDTLSGRLADNSEFDRRDVESKGFCTKLNEGVRSDDKFRKISFGPYTTVNIPGDVDRYNSFLGFPSPETSGQRIRNLQKVHVLKTASSAIMAQLTRAYVLPGEVHTRGKAQNETVSVLSQESLEQGETRFESLDSNTGGLGPKVRVVEFGGKAGKRGFVTEQEPRPNVVLRCVQGKVGRNIGKSSPVGQLESGGSKGTHKQAGVTGNMVCAERDGRISNRQSSGHILRQHDSPELHSEAGRDKILVPVRFGEAGAVVGGGEGNSTNTQVYRRKEKCGGRCPQQKRANNPHRVVFERPSVQQAVEVMGTSTSGPVCLKPKQKAANVFCPSPGPSSFGGGRNDTDLGQPRRLCLPSVCHAEEGHKQIRKIEELSNDVSGSMVASKGMVPGSDEAIDRRTKEAASQAGSSSSTRRQGSSSKRPKSSLDRMETVLRLAGAKKISKEVSKRINAARRHSTNELYQARWATFVSWCRKNGISASKPSINEVCKFLIYLWEKKKLSVGTIKGYRSTLNSVLRHSGMAISMDQDVSDVIRSFMVERPMQDKEKVMWNVDVVLKYLCSKRFEPLESASLRDLTKKTLFLVSLALAKRVSEVHALTRPVGFTSQGALVSLALKFRAKNDTKCKELPRNFLIKELTSLVGKEEEHKLCPVRAIKAYLDRTNPLGGMEATSLFLAPSNPSRGASKNALSYMLRSLIREAHVNLNPELLPMFKANVHEVRAVGTSLAFAHNMSLDTVIEAAQWRCNSVFASHYLKEIAIQYENCCTLGPLVTAGIVIP